MPTILSHLTLKITIWLLVSASVFVFGNEGEVVTDEFKLDNSIMLNSLKILDNTIVIFMSDNGPWYGGNTGYEIPYLN